jgi:hypothetical protein
MNPTNGKRLELCPFCGSQPRQSNSAGWFGTGCDGDTKCPAALSALMHRSQEAADAAWNSRAVPHGVETSGEEQLK